MKKATRNNEEELQNEKKGKGNGGRSGHGKTDLWPGINMWFIAGAVLYCLVLYAGSVSRVW